MQGNCTPHTVIAINLIDGDKELFFVHTTSLHETRASRQKTKKLISGSFQESTEWEFPIIGMHVDFILRKFDPDCKLTVFDSQFPNDADWYKGPMEFISEGTTRFHPESVIGWSLLTGNEEVARILEKIETLILHPKQDKGVVEYLKQLREGL